MAIAKDSSAWGEITRRKPLFIGGFDLLVPKVDSGKILT
jgi:hypothetical protein